MLSSFSLDLLLSQDDQQPMTLWRSPSKVGGKVGAPVQVAVIEQGIITPVLGSSTRLVPEAMLAGVRSPHILQVPGAVDIRPGDDIKEPDGTKHEVQHTGVWGGDGMTMAVLSKIEGV